MPAMAREALRSFPRRRPPARKRPKEKRKGLIVLVGVSGLNSSYDYLRLREIFHGSRRQSASTMHVIPSIDQPITDVIANLVLNRLDNRGLTSRSDSEAETRKKHESIS